MLQQGTDIITVDLNPLPTDSRQVAELLLTSAQGLFAVVLLINLRISAWEAATLAVLFLLQFSVPQSVAPRYVFSILFLSFAAVLAVRQFFEMRPFFRRRRDVAEVGAGLSERT